MAYQSISKRQMPHLKVRAHELRAFSASWAYFNFISLEEIIKAAVWSSSTSIFAKFYFRDFQKQKQIFISWALLLLPKMSGGGGVGGGEGGGQGVEYEGSDSSQDEN